MIQTTAALNYDAVYRHYILEDKSIPECCNILGTTSGKLQYFIERKGISKQGSHRSKADLKIARARAARRPLPEKGSTVSAGSNKGEVIYVHPKGRYFMIHNGRYKVTLYPGDRWKHVS